MADVSAKAVTRRLAVAGGKITLGREAFALLAEGRLPRRSPGDGGKSPASRPPSKRRR